MIGETIEQYKILETVGRGGMGVVYKAVDINLDRIVAVKVLSAELRDDPEFVQRFRQEARVQASLNHPNIAMLFDFLVWNSSPVAVMEFIDGETLQHRLQHSGPIPAHLALPLFVQALRGVAAGHRRGIIHRDLKPANLMITDEEVVKITDFGIAKMQSSTGLTQFSTRVGSSSYMSPEQILGRSVDVRTDIYAMGVTLYEMLCGRPPFQARTSFELESAHVRDTPLPPIAYYPQIPRPAVDAVMRALSKDPNDRFATAEQFIQALPDLHGIPFVDPDTTKHSPERAQASRADAAATGATDDATLLRHRSPSKPPASTAEPVASSAEPVASTAEPLASMAEPPPETAGPQGPTQIRQTGAQKKGAWTPRAILVATAATFVVAGASLWLMNRTSHVAVTSDTKAPEPSTARATAMVQPTPAQPQTPQAKFGQAAAPLETLQPKPEQAAAPSETLQPKPERTAAVPETPQPKSEETRATPETQPTSAVSSQTQPSSAVSPDRGKHRPAGSDPRLTSPNRDLSGVWTGVYSNATGNAALRVVSLEIRQVANGSITGSLTYQTDADQSETCTLDKSSYSRANKRLRLVVHCPNPSHPRYLNVPLDFSDVEPGTNSLQGGKLEFHLADDIVVSLKRTRSA